MRIRRLRWTRYRIPFAAGLATAHGLLAAREGLIVLLETDAGAIGLGEAAPLPEFGGGTVEEAAALLRAIESRLVGQTCDAAYSLVTAQAAGHPAASAVRCALDVALLDVQGRSAGQRVAELLTPCPASSVPLNATVAQTMTADAVAAARRAVAAGFRTIKLKVGVASSPEAEEERVASVRSAIGPEVALRLDANGAWTTEQAIALIRRLERYDIDLVEQPVSARDLEGLAQVHRAVSAPVGADEALSDPGATRSIIAEHAADVLIIKPMAVGGLRAAREIIELASAADLGAIVTTAFDAGIGTAAALQLAATLPAPIQACGLATASLLESDLLTRSLRIEDGQMALPANSGLGVELDEEASARYTIGDEG